VGFRPFVYSLATSLGLVGNDTGGVFAEVEGGAAAVRRFLVLLEQHAPPLARIERVTRYCRIGGVAQTHTHAQPGYSIEGLDGHDDRGTRMSHSLRANRTTRRLPVRSSGDG